MSKGLDPALEALIRKGHRRDTAPSIGIRCWDGKGPRSDGGHLRTALGCFYGGHDVTADSRARLKEQSRIGVDLKLRAVGGQARPQHGSDGGHNGSTRCCSWGQHHFRVDLFYYSA